MTPISRKPHDAGSHDQQMTPAVQAAIDAADKRMPAGCTTPEGCRPHGCHGACLPGPAETAIRAALAAGPTPGPWRVDADGGSAGPKDGFSPFGGCGCCGSPWMSAETDAARQADARLIAACNPAALAELLAELDRERNRSQMYADLVRGVAVALHGPGYTDASKLAEEVEGLKADKAEAWRVLAAHVSATHIVQQAMQDGVNVHGALGAYLAAKDEAEALLQRAAIDAAKGGAA